jgi:hypothetical protein
MRGLIGVVHLLPLPGDPGYRDGGFAAAYARAQADAEALVRGGVDGLIVENFGSAPFVKGTGHDRIPAQQAAALAHVSHACKQLGVPVGVNCLRNDGMTALGIAAACGLDFVRINVHIGAYVTDQGLIEGEAHATLRWRQQLDASRVEIWADVLVKHAAPLAPIEPETATRDCVQRGMADAVVVTGEATGLPVSVQLLERVRSVCAGRPVVIGSGLSPERVSELLPWAEAAIVGTWVKHEGQVRNPVDPDRVRALVEACRGRFAG